MGGINGKKKKEYGEESECVWLLLATKSDAEQMDCADTEAMNGKKGNRMELAEQKKKKER